MVDASALQGRFGRRLRELRRERGLSQSTLAERADITPEHVSRIERGVVSPSLEVMDRLAEALGVELKALFEFGPARPTPDAAISHLADIARQASSEERRLIVRLAEQVVRYRTRKR